MCNLSKPDRFHSLLITAPHLGAGIKRQAWIMLTVSLWWSTTQAAMICTAPACCARPSQGLYLLFPVPRSPWGGRLYSALPQRLFRRRLTHFPPAGSLREERETPFRAGAPNKIQILMPSNTNKAIGALGFVWNRLEMQSRQISCFLLRLNLV